MSPTAKIVALVVAIILFLMAGLDVSVGHGLSEMNLAEFGLAAFAAAHLP